MLLMLPTYLIQVQTTLIGESCFEGGYHSHCRELDQSRLELVSSDVHATIQIKYLRLAFFCRRVNETLTFCSENF